MIIFVKLIFFFLKSNLIINNWNIFEIKINIIFIKKKLLKLIVIN